MKVRITGIVEGGVGPAAAPGTEGAPSVYNVQMVETSEEAKTAAAAGPAGMGTAAPGGFSVPFRDVSKLTVSAEYDLVLTPLG